MRLSSLNCCLENFVGNLKFPIYKGASTHMVIKTRIRFCVFQIKFTNLALKFTNYIITLAVYQFLPTCVKYSHNGNFLLHILALIEKKIYQTNVITRTSGPLFAHLGGILKQRLKANWF